MTIETIKLHLQEAMTWLGRRKDTIFLGQNLLYKGHQMTYSLKFVKKEKIIEMPVAEDMQMGISIGLAMEGFCPITIYPRFDFLILATNQIVNHLDKLSHLMNISSPPRVIIRTMVGTKYPLDAGQQHTQDHTEAFKLMSSNITIWELNKNTNFLDAYKEIYHHPKSSLVIEKWQ